MAVTSYATLDGEFLSESRGGTRRDYLPDPLGSTSALLDSSQAKTDTWTYWPYGEERTRTGTTATPFQFVGTLGYYEDDSGRIYVRARHYRPNLARWQTVDLIWPGENAYAYSAANPCSAVDPSGLWHWIVRNWPDGKFRRWVWNAIPWTNDPRLDALIDCIDGTSARCNKPTSWGLGSDPADALRKLRDNASGKPDFFVDFGGSKGLCKGRCGYTNYLTSPATIYICQDAFTGSKCSSPVCTVLHEILHVPGMDHDKGGPNDDAWQCLKTYFGC